MLLASKALRQNDDTRNVYFNPDLTKMEAKLAYEKRVKNANIVKMQLSIRPL